MMSLSINSLKLSFIWYLQRLIILLLQRMNVKMWSKNNILLFCNFNILKLSCSTWVAIKILCYITELNLCPHLVSQILGYWNVKEAIKEGWADVADGIHGFCFNRVDIYVTKRRQKMEGISENVNKWQLSSFPCIFWFSFNFIFSLTFIRDD